LTTQSIYLLRFLLGLQDAGDEFARFETTWAGIGVSSAVFLCQCAVCANCKLLAKTSPFSIADRV